MNYNIIMSKHHFIIDREIDLFEKQGAVFEPERKIDSFILYQGSAISEDASAHGNDVQKTDNSLQRKNQAQVKEIPQKIIEQYG